MDNWIYFGVFLDKNSSEYILNKVGEYVPENWKLFCHHMTIAFNNKTENVENLYQTYKERFGEKVNLTITELGISDDAIAVKVNYDGEIMNDIPHITVATPINGKPVNSNFIRNWKPIESFNVTGTLNAFMKK